MDLESKFKLHFDKLPTIADDVYIAASAEVIGDVHIGAHSSVWSYCVLRADTNSITIGESTNIQEGTLIHISYEQPVIIGDVVSVGHGAMLHACTLEDECLVGMRATILDGAVIGKGSVVGAHSLVTQGMHIPAGFLAVGVPAKVIRPLSPEEQSKNLFWTRRYVEIAKAHKKKFNKALA